MIVDEVALTLNPKISPKTAVRLLDVFSDARKLFRATTAEIVERAGVRPDIAREISSRQYHSEAEQEVLGCRKKGIEPIGVSSPFYPALLRECCDYPPVLYVMGNPAALQARMLAVVGTRKISPYGVTACEKLISGLADSRSDLTIVSGLAYGVDSTAHRAALACGLGTVAVLGNRLPRIYPAEHGSLARKIVDNAGAVVSELHSRSYEGRTNFVARNRIIAGMSQGTLVIESPDKGGSMITAEMAFGYDRVVMAVPGRITDDNSAGTNRLIRTMKAASVCDGADILNELGFGETQPIRENRHQNLKTNPVPFRKTGDPVMDLIGGCEQGATVDFISDRTGLAASEVMASLFTLELEGMVKKLPGGKYLKT